MRANLPIKKNGFKHDDKYVIIHEKERHIETTKMIQKQAKYKYFEEVMLIMSFLFFESFPH